jgi:hypothetical protein
MNGDESMRTAVAILTRVTAVILLSFGHCAVAQSDSSGLFRSRLTLQGGGENAALSVHRDALGRPCLDFEAASRAHVINPNVYDHVVSIHNRCVKLIKLNVCYYGSDRCIDMEVPALSRKDGILGIYPSMRFFRYSYKEKP